tara:strand:- start:501 stop:2891 length:2391 start_codon:yes stop_codon:yes gene_type:complete
VNLIRAVSLTFVLFIPTLNAGYIYEANQSLIDLKTNYIATSNNMGVGDDQVSSAFNLDFTFTFYGEDFTSARMATNGCLHFGSSGGYCNDYTPDPLPEITYTLYPFWTDLIRDNGSSVLARNFTDKTVFGWYNLREYNRGNTDNSFEVILWKSDDSFEFRYGALDIINHDVLIGEQGAADELYTYLFHDECSTGTTNVAGTCVNTNWNNTSFNTLLENGGSLYGLGSGNALDCSNPLNNTACSGYGAAYLTQQCDLDGLYSTQCPNYWDDLFDYECTLDSQYSPACAGYMVETFVQDTYYEEDMYGYETYEEEQYGYTESYYEEDYYYEEELIYIAELQGLDPYQEELYFEEQYYEEELYYEETLYFEEEYLETFIEEFDLLPEEIFIPLSYIEEEPYIEQIYEEILLVEEYYETNYDLPVLEDVLLNHFEYQENLEEYIEEEEIEFLEFETIEEIEEWIESEESEEILEQLADSDEEEFNDLEDNETIDEESEDREETIEVVIAEGEDKKDSKKAKQLNVVADSIRAASNSVSGTTSGTSAQATGTSISSGGSYASSVASGGVSNTTSTAVASSASGGGISTSNSPSISAQVTSSAIQTQQVLSMSSSNVAVGGNNSSVGESGSNTMGGNNASVGSSTTVASNTSTNTSVSSNTTGSQNVAVGQSDTNNSGSQNTAVGSMELEISTAMSEMPASEADLIADQIVAKNIEDQQEQLEQQQQETGEYADESQLIAYMGYVQGFNGYTQVELPKLATWYEPEDIYANANIPDNNVAFAQMYGKNLNEINNLISMQPNL